MGIYLPYPQLSSGPVLTTRTLFGQPAAPATLTVDPNPYTLGIQFVAGSGGTLDLIEFYSAPGAAALPTHILLYAVSGRALVADKVSPAWSGPAGSGWVTAAFDSAPVLTAGAAYKACVFQPSSASWYASTGAYWTAGAGAGGIVSGALSAPNSAGGDGGQCTYNLGAIAYPLSTFNGNNYWIDAQVTY